MIEYQVLTGDSPDELWECVNKAIEAGWTPLGGVAASQSVVEQTNERKGYTDTNWYHHYAQAMVREKIAPPAASAPPR